MDSTFPSLSPTGIRNVFLSGWGESACMIRRVNSVSALSLACGCMQLISAQWVVSVCCIISLYVADTKKCKSYMPSKTILNSIL